MKLKGGRLALTIVALTCAAAVAGCASSGSSSQPGASGSTAASPPACPTSSLQVKLGVGQGYAGGVYVVIDFTNTGASTCSLFGYPGVSLVKGPPYTQIGLAAKRSATCGPTKATALKIYPPNQTEPVYLPNTSNGCAKPVQIMYIGAVRPGSGSSS